mgnify:CR=1 FL=1
MVAGNITRESVRQALIHGIKSEQVLASAHCIHSVLVLCINTYLLIRFRSVRSIIWLPFW